jgi:transcriptional regulator with XRE-family HTH domain
MILSSAFSEAPQARANWHTMDGAPMDDKFREWLRKLPERSGRWGEKTDIAKLTGLSASYVNRILSGDRGADIGLKTLETIAQHRKCAAWQVLWMVEHGVADLPPDMKSIQ